MVELSHIQFNYKKNKPLFNDLNLTLSPGHIYGLLGKNGAGKSTLLKNIAGLVFPKSGEASIFGIPVKDRSPEMLQDIYVVPEEFNLPAIKLKSYASINGAFYPKFNHAELNKYLSEFEISDDVKITSLSYGQKKKFLIAFGLATNARVLILDEPTNGLDIPSKSQFRKILASALDENKLIIISTHQVRDLENLIDSVVVLEKGEVIFNREIISISEKLSFDHDLNGIPESEILYTEEISGKRAGIVKNISGIETRVDLELLFNGVVKNNSLINSQLSN